MEIAGEAIGTSITFRIVALARERDIPEFIRDAASDDDAFAPGLISRSADFNQVLTRNNTGDVIALIELVELTTRNQCVIDANADLDRVRFECDGSAVNENTALKIEAIAESIKENAAGSGEK